MKNKYIVFISIGIELVGSIMVGIFLGQYLVKEFNLNKNLPVFLLLLFLILWFLRVLKLLKQTKNND